MGLPSSSSDNTGAPLEPSLYELLEVSPNAGAAVIKAPDAAMRPFAFRRFQ